MQGSDENNTRVPIYYSDRGVKSLLNTGNTQSDSKTKGETTQSQRTGAFETNHDQGAFTSDSDEERPESKQPQQGKGQK